MPSQPAILVIGAGISGLCAAYTLARQGKAVTLIEASNRVGGVIHTVEEVGYLWEAGPNTLSSTAHALLGLCDELGLTPVAANPASKNRYIYHAGKLHPAPADPISFIRTPLLSPRAKLSLMAEGLKPRRKIRGEECIADWASRRLGPEVLTTLLGPFLSGIYAGDPVQLSVAATLPKLAQWEADYGSLTAGAISSLLKPKTIPRRKRYKGLQILSFDGGLQTLPQALERAFIQAGGTLYLNTTAVFLKQIGSRSLPLYQLTLSSGQTLETKQICLATDTLTAARLLEPVAPQASKALQAIPYAAMAGVHLGIPREQVPHPLDGFGCLIPRTEGLTLLGSIWGSSLFLDRAPQGQALFSNFIGGASNPEVADWSDERCVETVLADLQRVLGATAPLTPSYVRVVRWPRAIPQYTLGHLDRLVQVEQALQDYPGIHLLGNYQRGVSLNHCAEQAITLSKQIGMGSSSDEIHRSFSNNIN